MLRAKINFPFPGEMIVPEKEKEQLFVRGKSLIVVSNVFIIYLYDFISMFNSGGI